MAELATHTAGVTAQLELLTANGVIGETVRVIVRVGGGEPFVYVRYEPKGGVPIHDPDWREAFLDTAFKAMRSRAVIR